MKIAFSIGACVATLAASFAAAPQRAPERERADAAFARLVEAETDWRAARAAQEELAALGEHGYDVVRSQASRHENPRVRLACYTLLTDAFASQGGALDEVANDGLADTEMRIRYLCTFQLGEQKVFSAHRALRNVLESTENDELIRYTAAKSLAQLGESDVLPVLYEAATSEWYMQRNMGNAGLQALTGRTLNDFDGYDWSEGAFVSGGVEARSLFDAVDDAETKAKRYAAAAAFFRWLKTERPEMYKHVTFAL